MKKWLFRIFIFIVVTLIFGIFFVVFREQIFNFFSSKKEKIIVPKKNYVEKKITYYENFTKAQELINEEYYNLASVELFNVIKQKPKWMKPYLLLGEIYIRTGNFEKLNNLINELKSKFENHPQIFVLEARKLIAQKNFEDAIKILNEKNEDLPNSLKFYRAVLLALQNNHSEAKEILKKLERLPLKKIDTVFTTEEKKDDEENDQDEKNKISVELSKKIHDLVIVYEEFENFTEGKNPHLFIMIAKSLAQNHEAILAQKFSDIAITEDISYVDAWILRGYSYFLLQKYEEALLDLNHAYELDPIRTETHYFLGLVLYYDEQYKKAALFFEKCLDQKFEFSAEIRWKLVDIFMKQENYDRVMELYKELLEYEKNPQKFVKALHVSIDLLKKPTVALEITERLLQESPKNIFIMNIYAWTLIANGKYLEAEQILNAALEIDSENARTYLNLGLIYEKKEAIDEAIEFYKKSHILAKKKGISAIVNLTAEKHNELLQKNKENKIDKPKHSP